MKKPDYTLIKSDRKSISLQIKNGEIIVRAPKKMKKREIDRFVSAHIDWIEEHLALDLARRERLGDITPLTASEMAELKKRAQSYIPPKVEHYAKIMGVDYKKISFRFQTSRWGSCSAEGNLSFNCMLMLTPDEVIDAIIIHELAHRKEMNHSKKFYAEILRVCPDYYARHAYLKQNQNELMRKNPNYK